MGQKMLTDANRRLIFVPSIANYHAPVLASLTGVGVIELSCNVTAANYALGSTGDDAINDPAACASSNSTVPGRTNYEAAFDFFRWKDALDDKAWTTFTAKGIHGYLVERIGQIEDGEKAHEVPFATGDEVRVFEIITGTPQVLSPSGAGYEKFKINFSVQDQVDERAVVAAA
jgi:hypothetical protein